jgi:hypothetical protein
VATHEEVAVTLTDWERRQLEHIERELASLDPRLARRLCTPRVWTRLMWSPQYIWVSFCSVGLLLAFAVVGLVFGFSNTF